MNNLPSLDSNHSNSNQNNSSTQLTSEQIDLLNGTLLGDGNLSTASGGKTWRYRAVQSNDQKDYLLKKQSILANLCGSTPPFSMDAVDKRTNLVYPRMGFNTLTSELLLPFGKAFYTLNPCTNKFEKRVPLDLFDRLNARTLAWLYGDDGALKWRGHSNATRLCVEGFTKTEVLFMIETINAKFNLSCKPEKKRDSYNIYFPEKSYSLLKELIGPHLHPDLYYRFPDGNKRSPFKGMN